MLLRVVKCESLSYNLIDKSVEFYGKRDRMAHPTELAMLFDRDRSVISRHTKSIYKEGELNEKSTCAFFARVPSTRKRSYESVMYNLDVIISVGYCVKSGRGFYFGNGLCRWQRSPKPPMDFGSAIRRRARAEPIQITPMKNSKTLRWILQRSGWDQSLYGVCRDMVYHPVFEIAE